MLKLKLHWQILIALALAVVAGIMSMEGVFFDHVDPKKIGPALDVKLLGFSFLEAYKFVGDIFLNALKMIVVPLIAASIITSIASMKETKGLGRLGLKTILFYLVTSSIAIIIGLAMVNLVKPGLIDGKPADQVLGISKSEAAKLPDAVKQKMLKADGTKRDVSEIRDAIVNMVPQNIVQAASNNGKLLAVIVFCILFAVFMSRIKEQYRDAQLNFWQGLFEIMMAMTHFIMKFAPIGVFGLVAAVVAGVEPGKIAGMFSIILAFFLTTLGALAIHAFIVIPLILKFVARVSPVLHFKAMRDALLTAFSTSSSAATLPITIECVEKNAGVSKRTASFVLPLGATVNMDGTALYECVAVMFLAQVIGFDISFGQQVMVVILALLTSIGVAGVPSASLFAIIIIAESINPAILGIIAIIYFVDRPLDMLRTSVNVLSDSAAAVTIARSEGEDQILIK